MPAFHTFRPHPWHGVSGEDAPAVVMAYVEITPFDAIKYEVDKETGYLMVDRPQPTNSLPPTLYGFVPRTYCGPHVARLAGLEKGDGDPLDICILSERPINRADILLRARPLGGLLMNDAGEADDKIIAVIEKDPIWGGARTLNDVPTALVERLRHYFLTYKLSEGRTPVVIDAVYGVDRAHAVIEASRADYADTFER
jgi:inorganic pyrophosphatase